MRTCIYTYVWLYTLVVYKYLNSIMYCTPLSFQITNHEANVSGEMKWLGKGGVVKYWVTWELECARWL